MTALVTDEVAARPSLRAPARGGLVVPGSPVDLAVVRIVFFAVAFQVSLTSLPADMAELPGRLRTTPTGAGWLYWLVEPTASVARVGSMVMAVAALAALFGWRTRWAAATWALTAAWTLGITDLYGKVDHNHHLVWFAVVLAASPCADVLSVDALRRGAAPLGRQVRYGLPVRVLWLLIGLVYFFAGFWKVAEQGLAWASPANLRPLLHAQWAAVDGFTPAFRIDQMPVLLVLMGLGTLVFELGFVVAVFTRFRPWAVGAGLAFHLGTYLLLNISFTTLVLCYVVFVPWGRALGDVTGSTDDVPRPDRATVAVGAALVGAVVLAGAGAVVDGWPVAAYPTFAERSTGSRTAVELEVELSDGSERLISVDDVFAWVPAPKRVRLAGQVLALPTEEREAVLRSIDLTAVVGQPVEALVAHRAVYSTDPDDPTLLPRSVLVEVDLR